MMAIQYSELFTVHFSECNFFYHSFLKFFVLTNFRNLFCLAWTTSKRKDLRFELPCWYYLEISGRENDQEENFPVPAEIPKNSTGASCDGVKVSVMTYIYGILRREEPRAVFHQCRNQYFTN